MKSQKTTENSHDTRMYQLLANAARHSTNTAIDFEKPLTDKDHLAALHRMNESNVPYSFQIAYKKYFSIESDGTRVWTKRSTQNNLDLTKRLRVAEEIIERQQQDLKKLSHELSTLRVSLETTISYSQADEETEQGSEMELGNG